MFLLNTCYSKNLVISLKYYFFIKQMLSKVFSDIFINLVLDINIIKNI